MTRRLAMSLLVLCLAAGARADSADLDAILKDVAKITAPGLPGPLCLAGEKAFAIVAGASGKTVKEPVVAASRWGKGRVVAFGHDGYFGRDALAKDDTGTLMANLVRWAGGAAVSPRVGAYHCNDVAAFLKEKGFTVIATAGADWPKLADVDVLVMNPHSVSKDSDLAAVADFVQKGGGVILSSCGWGWAQLNPGKKILTDHAGNRLIAPAGIVFTDGTVEQTVRGGYDAQVRPSPLCNASAALDFLLAQSKSASKPAKADLTQASAVLSRAARSLPGGDTLLRPRLQALMDDPNLAAVPSAKKPLKSSAALQRVVLTLQLENLRTLAPQKVKAHPAAAEFPGLPPADAPRVTKTVEIDTKVPAWHSTGLYAAPGEVVQITLPAWAAGKGISVRVGCHTDTLWHLDSWSRAPEISTTRPLDKPVTEVASAFGGLIYIDVPDKSKVPAFSATIANAIEAPLFVEGKTTVEEWKKTIRLRPAPWAELASDKVILAVPAKHVRQLDNPDELMALWDRILDACADLATRPRQRQRPERYVSDVQISVGYMHSGYPIMTWLDAPEAMTSVEKLSKGQWGLFHEMGHNHQSGDWTFDGTVEVTVNLFSMYVCQTVCGLEVGKGHEAISPASREKKIKAYMPNGTFEQWKEDPFLALVMYIQLEQAFGWDAYKKVFAEYRDLPRGQHPRNDDEKRDQWMVRFSRAVGKNLGPFFQAWRVPTSQKARESIADLPTWMPENFPPK